MTTQLATGITGNLTRLPPLPNAEHQRLFNAENCTISADGRVFVTGSTAVYEVLQASGGADPENPRYEYREISITAPEVPLDCLRNGITTSGHYLYLACAHVHQWDTSVFPEWGAPLNSISQTQPINLLRLLMTETFGHVDSYIVRADLRRDPLQFSDCFVIPEKCLANGLAAHHATDHHVVLYVANSVFGDSCIFRIVWPANQQSKEQRECAKWFTMLTHQLINGLKFKAESVYYTCVRLLPPGAPTVCRIDVHDGDAGDATTIYSTFGFFDDMDVSKNGLILANGSDPSDLAAIAHLPPGMPHGSLIFVSRDGKVLDVFKDEQLIHPSSVKIVDCESRLFARGDVIVTDKGVDGEYAAFVFTPDDTCRSWFI